MTHKRLITINRNEELIKKSTFVAISSHVETQKQAEIFIAEHSDLQATHNCWAYQIGQSYRFNDDGEPSGTAGKPILNAIQNANFDRTIALVIRYYGGIKLGAGGLARAYGGTAAKNLNCAEFKTHIPRQTIEVTLPFEYSQYIHQLQTNGSASILSQEFKLNGVCFSISCPSSEIKETLKQINNHSKGKSKVKFQQS
ncbi:MAG: YigZ family protein [Rhodobacteraceae bacterium]|nr:YigZ family protein [Paracoccaceae bacterium]